MQPIEKSCPSSRIDDYLADRLGENEQSDFEQHLTTCDECRNELERRAAQPEMWNEAADYLTASVVNSSRPSAPSSDRAGNAADDFRGEERTHQSLSVLDSLTPTDDPDMLGRIDEYEISGVIGVGGMGAVLKGFDKSLRRVVAIKVMAPHLAGSGSARTRFQREARAAAAITHDNVIDIYGVSEAGGLPYLVMPFARGPSLQKRIDEGGPLSVVEVVRIARQIASGLAAAHDQGLVHRDIKPANILLSEGIERLWITDFGVARAMDDASMTQTGLVAGTPQYMSPEQARGESVDLRSDLFSLGSILYTACTGRPPFRSETAYGILRRITDSDPRPIRDINPDVPAWLCHFIDRLMAKHPADRFDNAGEVVDVMDKCLAHLQQPTQIELPSCVVVAPRRNAASRLHQQENTTPPKPSRRSTVPRWGIWTLGLGTIVALTGFALYQLDAPEKNPVTQSANPITQSAKKVTSQTIAAPTKGYIKRWGEGIETGARVTHGQLICEVVQQDAEYQNRLFNHVKDAQKNVQVMQEGLDASRQNHQSQIAITKTLEAQVSAYEKAKEQILASADSGIESQKNQIEAERARMAENEASLKLASTEYERAKALRKEAIVSELKFQNAEQKFRKSQAKVDESKALIRKEENDLQAKQSDRLSKQEKADANLMYAESVLAKARGEVAEAEETIAKARGDLAKAEKEVLETQTKLARRNSFMIVSPFDGIITELISLKGNSAIKEGDTICIVWPQTAKADSQPSRAVDTKQPRQTRSSPVPAKPNSPADSARVASEITPGDTRTIPRIASMFGPAGDLARRLRESREGHRSASQAYEALLERINQMVSEREKIEKQIQEVSGEPTKDEIDSIKSLAEQVRYFEKNEEAAQRQLSNSRRTLDEAASQLAEAEAERRTILELLSLQVEAAESKSATQETLMETVEHQFELGDATLADVLRAKQVFQQSESEWKQLQILLDFYRNLSVGESDDGVSLDTVMSLGTFVWLGHKTGGGA